MSCSKLLSLIAIIATAASAETHWIHIHSQNFEIYSSASEGSTRETLRYFEQVRSFFLEATGQSVSKPVPIYIIAFGSEKEYLPFRPNEFATAFYRGGAERDYIVLSHGSAEIFPVATHEYVHLVVQHAGLNFPPWLNEGLSELYSTLKPLGDQVIVGNVIAGRVQALYREKWVPLAAILSAGRDSPYYNEKSKAGSLYNEGWALVHMLALNEEYRSKFNGLLNAIANGSPSVTALEQTYGKPLASIEKDLQAYLRGDRFNGAVIRAKLMSEKTPLQAEIAPPFDVKLALAELAPPGKQSDTEARLKELTRDNPQRPEPWAGLAYLAWSRGRMEDTEQNFAQAYLLGARSQRLLWDYGRLAFRDRPQEAINVFSELLNQQPERTDVRMELAAAQISLNQPADALATLAPIKKTTPQDAPRLFTLLAYAQLGMGQRDQAANSVARIAQYAATPADRDRADQLKKYLEQPNQPSLTPLSATEGGRPRLVRRTAAGFEEKEPPTSPTASLSTAGVLVELVCDGQRATIVLETDQQRKRFLIQDPTRIKLVAGDGAAVHDFQCGPQKPAKIKVEYRLAEGGQNVDGLVTAIYFQP